MMMMMIHHSNPNLNEMITDQVPHGVVNSMKQRLLDQFNQNRVDAKRLCRSQENLSSTISFHSYVKKQPNVIIIEKNTLPLKSAPSHSEIPIDEIPKPGKTQLRSSMNSSFCALFSRNRLNSEEYV